MFNYLDIMEYLNQIHKGDYQKLTDYLYDFIQDEGWVEQLQKFEEDGNDQNFTIDNFKYLILDISEKDKKGLMNFDNNTINKFNELDIALKNEQLYPYNTLDFIDYQKGIVYIVRTN